MSQKEPLSAKTPDGRLVHLNNDGTWVFVSPPTGQPSQFTFRKTSWGMAKQAVLESEGGQASEVAEDFLQFRTMLLDLEVEAIYIFVEDVLVRAKYLVVTTHSNDNSYLLDFERLKDNLSKKYGKPKEDRKLWQDDLYREDPSQWGIAVANGSLSMFARWRSDDTNIFLDLSGDNFQCQLGVEYSSIRLAHLEESQRKRKTFDEL